MSSWWVEKVVPRVADWTCGSGQVHKRRVRVCRDLEGRVIEIGFGSGHNVQHYPPGVTEVHAVEPNDIAWSMAQPRLAETPARVIRSGLDGQRLDEPDATYDSALCTFTLCTLPDPAIALEEVRRVLRPGGTLHFLEHGVAPDESVRRWQRRLEPFQRRIGGGCHLTRQPAEAVGAAGFELVDLETEYLPGPAFFRPLSYVYLGTARKPA